MEYRTRIHYTEADQVSAENLTIRSADVTFEGTHETAIGGFINVFTSNAWLYKLTVTGPGRGVVVSDGQTDR